MRGRRAPAGEVRATPPTSSAAAHHRSGLTDGSVAGAAATLAADPGVAMIPRLGRGQLPPGVVAVPLDPVPVRRLYALWRTEAARRPAITAAVSALRSHGAVVGLSQG